MHEHDHAVDPDATEDADTSAAPSVDDGDVELDELAHDLDTVESALTALDADDLEQAEALAASLGGRDDGEPAAGTPPDPPSAEA